jgi:hypothetical protein
MVIVSHYLEPSSCTGARRCVRLARMLAERGARPVLVTAAPEFYGDAVVGDGGARTEFPLVEVPYRRAYRTLAGYGVAGGLLAKARLVLAYRAAIERAIHLAPRPHYLYFWSHPFWHFPLARYFHLRYGVPYVLDFADLFYMGGVRYRLGQRAGLRNWVDRAAEQWAVGGARLVLHTTGDQTRLYRERYPAKPPADFLTVRCGYDAALAPLVRQRSRRGDDIFRVGIFGKFASYSRADAVALARAASAFHVRRRVAVVHLGDREPALEAAFGGEGLSGCFIAHGMHPYLEGLSRLATVDCFVLNAISDVSLPAKLYEYILLNRPIVALVSAESTCGRFLARFPGAFLARTAEEIADALEQIAGRGLRRLAPDLEIEQYNQQHEFERLLAALRPVPPAGGPGA